MCLCNMLWLCLCFYCVVVIAVLWVPSCVEAIWLTSRLSRTNMRDDVVGEYCSDMLYVHRASVCFGVASTSVLFETVLC